MCCLKKTKRYELIADERDVTKILEVVNRYRQYYDFRVGNCGWALEPTKWFIMFHATDKVWINVLRDLQHMGDIHIDIRPGGQMDLCFKSEKN